jgi:ABC-2 type transport system permease protein
MSVRRIFVLLKKELVMGPKNLFFVFALVVPLVLTLLLNLLAGNFFAGKPKLGLAGGPSALIAQAVANDGLIVRLYENETVLREATAAGTVDMGLYLPADFDGRLAQDEPVSVTIYVWGESLLRDRISLATTIVGLSRAISGQEAPLRISEEVVGESDSLPWSERLLPLIVLMTVIFGGSMVPASAIIEEKQQRTLTAVTVTSTTLAELFAAKGLLGVILSMLMGVVILALNNAFGSQPALLLFLLLLAAIMAAAFGVLLGALIKDMTNLFATMKATGLLLYAPGFLYIFPDIPAWVGKIFPTYYIIAPMMAISLFDGRWADIQTDLFILIGLILLLLGVVAAVVHRARRQPTMLPGLS